MYNRLIKEFKNYFRKNAIQKVEVTWDLSRSKNSKNPEYKKEGHENY